MGHWAFIGGAYALVYGVLLVYWWRGERAIRALESAAAATRRGAGAG